MIRTSKTSLRWLRPILLTIGAILLFCSLLLGYTLSALRQNMLDASGDLNQYLQQSTDARLREIQKYAASLELNPVNTALKKQEGQPLVTQEIYRFSDQMNNYKVTNKLLQGIFIYYPHAQLMVGSLGCRNPAAYYALDNPLNTQGLEEWLAQIEGAAGGFALLQSNSRAQFCYIRPMIQDNRTAGYAVFQFDTEELLQATRQLTAESPTQAAFGILLGGQLVAYSGDGALLQTLLTEETGGAVLQRRASDFESLQYVNVYIEQELLRPFSIALLICVVGVVACALFGALASVYISRRNVAPLRRLITRLGADEEECQDECQAIGRLIDNMMQARDLSEEKLQAQQNLIGGLFLNEVLTGELHSEYAVFSAAKRCDVLFEQPYYLVGVIAPTQEEPEDRQSAALLNWLSKQGYDATVSFYCGRYVLLLNLPEEIQQRALVPLLRQLLEELFADSGARAALGRRFDSLTSIPVSYNQAVAALRRPPGETVLCYSGLAETEPERDLLTIAAQETFAAALQKEQYAAAAAALDPLFDQCEASALPADVRRIRFAALQNLLLDALRKGRAAGALEPAAFRTGEILNCTTLPQLRSAAGRLLQALQGTAPATLPEGTVAQRAQTIIKRDFTDPMLGLYMISDELKVSGSHLSTTFKSTFGIGVVQYINQLRIDQAKSLIKNTEMSIKEIALAVGFSSDISFIRVFKKYESQTPSSLRKQG